MFSGGEFVTQTFESHALQDDSTRTRESRKEQAFSTKDRCTNAADHLNVVIDTGFESDEMAGLDLQSLARGQGEIDMVATSMNKDQTGAGEFLEYEAFTRAGRRRGGEPSLCRG